MRHALKYSICLFYLKSYLNCAAGIRCRTREFLVFFSASVIRAWMLYLFRYSDTVHSDHVAEGVCGLVWSDDVVLCVRHSVRHPAVPRIRRWNSHQYPCNLCLCLYFIFISSCSGASICVKVSKGPGPWLFRGIFRIAQSLPTFPNILTYSSLLSSTPTFALLHLFPLHSFPSPTFPPFPISALHYPFFSSSFVSPFLGLTFNPARASWAAVSSPSGSGQSLATKWLLVNFGWVIIIIGTRPQSRRSKLPWNVLSHKSPQNF